MTLAHGLRRLVLASVICAILTLGPPGVLLLAWRSFVGAVFLMAIPLAVLVYAAGLLVAGVPLLWWWPAAFHRTRARGALAASVGAAVVLVPVGGLGGWHEDGAVVIGLGFCGALAGIVWWWLNFDAAPAAGPPIRLANDLH